ncbi:MAG: MarR family winged helix-turn-helix transcriptional regulator [Candidatus Zixiibacteriota bacterium]
MPRSSPFDPALQHDHVDSKILALLEHLSHALRFLLWEEGKQHHLSPIQIQTLVHIHYHNSELCRVGHIAEEFKVTQATMSDVISTLEEKKLVRRIQHKIDKRAYTIQLTPAGQKLAKELSTWANIMRDCIGTQQDEEKQVVMQFLMRLVESLQKEQVITVARMCVTCAHFRPHRHQGQQAPHHCALIDKPLAISSLRIDCPEHIVSSEPPASPATKQH